MKKKTFSMVAPTSAMIILSLAVFILIGLAGTAGAAVSTYHVLSSCSATRVTAGTPLTYALDSNPANCATPDDMRLPIAGAMDVLIGIKAVAEVTNVDLTAQATGSSITLRNRGTGTLDCYIDLNEYTAADAKIQTLSTISFLSVPTADNTYTDFSGLTGTVASGNKWGLLFRCNDPVTAPTLDMNGWGQVPAAATFSYYIAMDEVVGCSDPDPTTAVNVTPATSATVGGLTTVQAEIVGEGAPETGSAAVTITGSSACNVAAAPMTWNAGSSRWEYSWDTAACGNPVETNAVTISVDYTDPDCSNVTNGSSTSITLDNTCVDATPSTITVTGAQTFNGDPYNVGAGFTTTGNVGSFEYFVVNSTSASYPPLDHQQYFDTNETACDWTGWTATPAPTSCAAGEPAQGDLGTHTSTTTDSAPTHTASGSTGPTSLHSGTHGANGGFIYQEVSGQTYPTGDYFFAHDTGFSADQNFLNVSFASAVYGTGAGTLSFEVNDGTGWTVEWSQTGDDGGAGTWTVTNIDLYNGTGLSAKAYTTGTINMRFHWVGSTAFAGDMAIDTVRVFGGGRTMLTETTCTNWQASSSLPATTAGGSLCGDFADAGATHKLDVRGTDPDCGTLISSAGAQNFTWNACTDPDVPVITINPPISGSTVNGNYVITATVTNENGAMTGMNVTTTGTTGGICDVTGAAMTDAGGGVWTYTWNTTACGVPAESPITIDVSGNEPDCGGLTSATQVNAITVDNTCSDPDVAVFTINPPLTGSTVKGLYNVDVNVTNENGTASGVEVFINGSWRAAANQGGGVFRYAWDTMADYPGSATVPVTGLTIDAHGTDPDCTIVRDAAQVTSITVDNADPYSLPGCMGCHSFPPADGSARNTPAGAVIGSHATHASIGLACTSCHVGNLTFSHREGQIEMMNNGTAYTKGAAFDQSNAPTPYGTCSSTNCHGTSSPTWADNAGTKGDCSICHGMAADKNDGRDTAGDTLNTDPQVGAHVAHLNTTSHGIYNSTTNIACNECHAQPSGATYAEKVLEGAGHNDGGAAGAELVFGAIATNGGTMSPTYTAGTCNNTWCHGDGLADVGVDPTWSTPVLAAPGTANCDKCHAYPPVNTLYKGAHPANTDCSICHNHVDANDFAWADISKHIDGIIQGPECRTCHSQVQDAGDGAPTRRAVVLEFANNGIGHMKYDVQNGDTATLEADCGKCHTESVSLHMNNTLDTPRGALAVGTAAYCIDCHKTGATNNDFTGDVAGAAMDINTAWTSTYNHSNPQASGAVECSACHGDGAGNARFHGGASTGMLKFATEKDTCFATCHGTGGTAVNKIQDEFNAATYTGGTHPVLATVTPKSTKLQGDTTGAMFVGGFTKDSVVTCSDCHGMTNGAPKGPHGGSFQFILKGLDTTITTTTSGRVMTFNNGEVVSSPANIERNFCINCHAADVYSLGSADSVATDGFDPSIASGNLSGMIHYADFRDKCGATDTDPGGDTGNGPGAVNEIGCTNCHGGFGSPGGLHGSSAGLMADNMFGGPFNAGFMDGDSWTQAPDSTNGCYADTGGNVWNTCNKGLHN